MFMFISSLTKFLDSTLSIPMSSDPLVMIKVLIELLPTLVPSSLGFVSYSSDRCLSSVLALLTLLTDPSDEQLRAGKIRPFSSHHSAVAQARLPFLQVPFALSFLYARSGTCFEIRYA